MSASPAFTHTMVFDDSTFLSEKQDRASCLLTKTHGFAYFHTARMLFSSVFLLFQYIRKFFDGKQAVIDYGTRV